MLPCPRPICISLHGVSLKQEEDKQKGIYYKSSAVSSIFRCQALKIVWIGVVGCNLFRDIEKKRGESDCLLFLVCPQHLRVRVNQTHYPALEQEDDDDDDDTINSCESYYMT
ncbi:hypothetical protein SAY87_030068 [Trapa incisa]|uniref:Uncharacterized protein n=1 Tax=Trapa incisa TaxID=236973 RepID=A0AAN7QAA5_9MYRT|nr:hypothetical protein SAY87_030068 [Trapa incisa]